MDITKETVIEKAYRDVVNYITELEDFVMDILAAGGKLEYEGQEELLAGIEDPEHPRAVAIGEALNVLANSLHKD